MTHSTLRTGMSGPQVRDLQSALNANLSPSPNLNISGVFDHTTRDAVRRYQTASWLEADGIAGPCTLNALFGRETFTPILHSVPFIPQPNPYTCWAASLAMLKRSSVLGVQMITPAALLGPNGDLINGSAPGTDTVAIHSRLAAVHHMTYHPPRSWTVAGMRQLISNGPVWVDLLWQAGSYSRGRASPGHAVVIIGARGTEAADGMSLTLRIYDPWPPGQGDMMSKSYGALVRAVPALTYGLITR